MIKAIYFVLNKNQKRETSQAGLKNGLNMTTNPEFILNILSAAHL
jgi:hypothetical protein